MLPFCIAFVVILKGEERRGEERRGEAREGGLRRDECRTTRAQVCTASYAEETGIRRDMAKPLPSKLSKILDSRIVPLQLQDHGLLIQCPFQRLEKHYPFINSSCATFCMRIRKGFLARQFINCYFPVTATNKKYCVEKLDPMPSTIEWLSSTAL